MARVFLPIYSHKFTGIEELSRIIECFNDTQLLTYNNGRFIFIYSQIKGHLYIANQSIKDIDE